MIFNKFISNSKDCSEVTRNLLIHDKKISQEVVVSLPSNSYLLFISFYLLVYFVIVYKPTWIPPCKVTLIDANHCPGAVIFIFEVFCSIYFLSFFLLSEIIR
jgi:hypothetical protein